MEINFINQLLKLMEKVMEWLQELYEAARQGGFTPFSLLPQKTAMELTTAHTGLTALDDGAIKREYQRMLTRNRVRRCRERKKLRATAATAGVPQAATGNENPNACNAETITGNAKNVTCNGETVTGNGVTALAETAQARMEPAAASAAVSENGNASVTACNAPVTPGNVFAKKEKETEKRKNQRKEINKNKKIKTNIADAMPKSARACTHEEGAETAGLFAETHYTAAETQTVENNANAANVDMQGTDPHRRTAGRVPQNRQRLEQAAPAEKVKRLVPFAGKTPALFAGKLWGRTGPQCHRQYLRQPVFTWQFQKQPGLGGFPPLVPGSGTL